jgi:hypothetical protein
METWPKILLPDPADMGYSGGIESSIQRSNDEAGAIQQRARSTEETTTLTVQWTFKPWQFLLFRAFVKHKLHLGADNFNIDLWFAGDTDAEECVARFVDGIYQFTFSEGLWKVSAMLEVENAPAMTEAEYDAILD